MLPRRIAQVQHGCQIPAVSLYLHALVWGKILLIQGSACRKKVTVTRFALCVIRLKVPNPAREPRLPLTETHTMSLFICKSSGWKQTSVIRCRLGPQLRVWAERQINSAEIRWEDGKIRGGKNHQNVVDIFLEIFCFCFRNSIGNVIPASCL